MKRHTEKSSRHWFSLYQLVERYLVEQSQDADEQVERLSLPSVSSTLQAFMEGTTLGQFHTRLAMLLGFHCHLLLVPSQPGQGGFLLIGAPMWLGKKIIKKFGTRKRFSFAEERSGRLSRARVCQNNNVSRGAGGGGWMDLLICRPDGVTVCRPHDALRTTSMMVVCLTCDLP